MCQASRMDDQRSSVRQVTASTLPDDDFFNLIQRLQSNRLETQRSSMTAANSSSHQPIDSVSSQLASEKKKKLNKKENKQ